LIALEINMTPLVRILTLMSVALLVRADIRTIIDTGDAAGGPSVNEFQYVAQGWTQTQGYDELSIFVSLYSYTPGVPFDITAYLTTSVGPSAGVVSQALETTSFTGETPGTAPQEFLLFSGLTLGPGTYYLTLAGTESAGKQAGAIWPAGCASSCTASVDPGITLFDEMYANGSFGVQNSNYPPGSTFNDWTTPVNLLITADPPSGLAPEPAAPAAALFLLIALVVVEKHRYRIVS
jgi:hypothetical protein